MDVQHLMYHFFFSKCKFVLFFCICAHGFNPGAQYNVFFSSFFVYYSYFILFMFIILISCFFFFLLKTFFNFLWNLNKRLFSLVARNQGEKIQKTKGRWMDLHSTTGALYSLIYNNLYKIKSSFEFNLTD